MHQSSGEEFVRPGPPHVERAGKLWRGLLSVLAVALLHALAWQLLLPAWQGEDEPWHFEMVEHVARGHWPSGGREFGAEALHTAPQALTEVLRRFPELERADAEALQLEIAADMERAQWVERVDFAPWIRAPASYDGYAPGYSAANQPPLAYVVTAGWLRCFDPATLRERLHCARVLAVLWFLIGCTCVYVASYRLWGSQAIALCAGASAALWPMHARQAAIVSNDALASMLGAVAILCAVQVVVGAHPLRWYAALVVSAALGLATKSTCAAVLVALVIAPALRPAPRLALCARWSAAGAAVAALLALAAWWSWSQQHSPALPKAFSTAGERLDRGTEAAEWLTTWSTFVGRTCWNTRGWSQAVEYALLLFPAFALCGLARAWSEQRAWRRGIVLCSALVSAQLALVALRGVGVGRYILPAALPLGALAALGAFHALPARARAHSALVWVGALAAYALLFGVLVLWNEQWLVLGA